MFLEHQSSTNNISRDWKHDIDLLRMSKKYPEKEYFYTVGGAWPNKKLYLFGRILSNMIPGLPVEPFARSYVEDGCIKTFQKTKNYVLEVVK